MKELYDRVRTAVVTNALTALSKQYETEMEQQAEWVGELQEQVQRLEESVKDLKQQQQARERQRGPERDYMEAEPLRVGLSWRRERMNRTDLEEA